MHRHRVCHKIHLLKVHPTWGRASALRKGFRPTLVTPDAADVRNGSYFDEDFFLVADRFLLVDFLLVDFLLELFFGILAPASRASFSAMATACFLLFTFLPLPDLSLPSLCSFITR